MRPLILMPTINSRNSNACYLQLLSVQRCQHPPAAERCCWGGGPDPPSSRALLLGGGSRPPSSRAHWTQLSRLFAAAPPSTLGSCLSGTLEAVVLTAPSSPIHLRAVECWRFTKHL